MGKKIVKKIVVAGDVLFGTHNFLKQNYVQQIIIWTRRRRENRDATLYSWNIWPVLADVSFYSWFQLFSSCFQPFFSCCQLIQPDRYVCSGSCCKQQQLTGFGFVF